MKTLLFLLIIKFSKYKKKKTLHCKFTRWKETTLLKFLARKCSLHEVKRQPLTLAPEFLTDALPTELQIWGQAGAGCG